MKRFLAAILLAALLSSLASAAPPGATGPSGVLSEGLHMPTTGISIVNFDNNQHGSNENVRIQNLWDGMEIIASVLTMAK